MKKFDDIVLHHPDWYEERGIDLVSGQVVVDINRKTKQVMTDALNFDYDRLLLCYRVQHHLLFPFLIIIMFVLSFRDIRDVNDMLEVTNINNGWR